MKWHFNTKKRFGAILSAKQAYQGQYWAPRGTMDHGRTQPTGGFDISKPPSQTVLAVRSALGGEPAYAGYRQPRRRHRRFGKGQSQEPCGSRLGKSDPLR
jgi:hypothetical protein